MNNLIKVKVFSLSKGLENYENIHLIRIKSKDYNLMILPNYAPILGDIEGYIELEMDEEIIKFENIKGYYINSKNEFSLIIREDL